MAVLSPVAKQQFFTDAGQQAAGYKLYTYAANTTTPQATYTNRAGTVANANPIVLDTQGRATIYLDPSLTYDYVLKTAGDVPVWTQEDVVAGGSNSADVSFLQSGTGAVVRTMQEKGRERVSILDFIPVSEHAAIRAGTSTYDCLDAVDNAVASISANAGTFNLGGPRIYFPPGNYYFTDTIQLKSTVILEGDAVGMSGGYATILTFPPDTHGIIVHRYNTIDDTVESPTSKGGDGSIIRNLRIVGAAGTVGHGIWLRARATLDNIAANGFAQNGVNIVASSGAGGSGEGNANCWAARNVLATNNGGHGFYVDGADANAGHGIEISATSNGKCGIYDSSFLGNTYVACHTSTNGSKGRVHYGGNHYWCNSDTLGGSTAPGTDATVWILVGAGTAGSLYPDWVAAGDYSIGASYRADSNNANNAFFGCYAEGGWNPSKIVAPSSVYGGSMTAGYTPDSTCFRIDSTVSNGRLTSFEVRPRSDHSNAFVTSFGRTADEGITLVAVGDNLNGLALAYWDNTNGCWAVRHSRNAGLTPIRFTTSLNTLKCGRSTAPTGGEVLFGRGFFMGGVTGDLRKQTNGTAAPSSGEYARGDIIWNRDPSASGKAGWICTTGGIAGSTAVFKQFGAIDP